MHGEVGVESEPGKGSTFWFKLVLEKQAQALPVPLPTDVELRGVRVLVADASASERQLMAEVVRAWGCDVTQAENGIEVLDRVREGAAMGRPIAVAVVNMQLPGLDGEDLGRAIRADADLDSTLLMLTTDAGRPGDALRARELGYSAYLHKPLNVSQLYEALTEVTGRRHIDLPPANRPLVTRHTLAEARRTRVRILLVEDDLVNQLVTRSALNRVGYHVEIAASGREAIERTQDERWDLILMDLQMPDLDGCGATAAIRARERGGWRTPILGLTGHSDHPGYREKCFSAGMDDVFGKPIDLALLTTAVERWTLRSEVRGDGTPSPSLACDTPASKVAVVGSGLAVSAGASLRPDNGASDMPEGPAIDLEQLNVASMGLPTLRTSLLHTYLGDVYPRLERLQEAVDAADCRRIEFEAHGLRGMCATIGACGCTMLFGEIEVWAREEHLPEIRAAIGAARDEVARSEEFIERLERILLREAA